MASERIEDGDPGDWNVSEPVLEADDVKNLLGLLEPLEGELLGSWPEFVANDGLLGRVGEAFELEIRPDDGVVVIVVLLEERRGLRVVNEVSRMEALGCEPPVVPRAVVDGTVTLILETLVVILVDDFEEGTPTFVERVVDEVPMIEE